MNSREKLSKIKIIEPSDDVSYGELHDAMLGLAKTIVELEQTHKPIDIIAGVLEKVFVSGYMCCYNHTFVEFKKEAK